MNGARSGSSTSEEGGAILGGQELFDLLVEAGEVLHRRGHVAPKLQWATDATRVAVDATLTAYVDFGGRFPRVRAASGGSIGEAKRIADRAGAGLIDRVRRTHRPAKSSGEVVDDESSALVVLPVLGADEHLYGALLVVVAPGAVLDQIAWVTAGIALHLGAALDTHATIRKLTALEAEQREAVTQLQEAVQPPAPSLDGAEVGVHFVSADPRAPTGGDLYDWHVLPDGDLHLAVIDVVGKGVTATKHALAVMHALRILVLEDCPLADVVAKADAVLADAHPDLNATLVVARYHPFTGRVRMAGAGHPPALLVSPDGAVDTVDVPGIPIGWPSAGSLRVVERFLERDQSLVLYTDGLVEARGDIVAGLDGLGAAAGQISGYPARFFAQALVERALDGATRRDDSLALVLRHRVAEASSGPHPGPFQYRFSPSPATVPLARHLLNDWLQVQPVAPRNHADLLFVATELCANAVMAASGAPGSVELRAEIDGDSVVIEVEDDGVGFQPSIPVDQPDAELERGRGLFLVKALSDELEVRREDGRTIIQAVRRAAVVNRAAV